MSPIENDEALPVLRRHEKLQKEEWKNQYEKSILIQELTYMTTIMSELDTERLYSVEDLINEAFSILMLNLQLEKVRAIF